MVAAHAATLVLVAGGLPRLTLCLRCRREFDDRVWRMLRLLQHIEDSRVRELVVMWPKGVAIEVRECDCGYAVARRVASIP